MAELLQAWRSKHCILDMYLTFFQMYSATESYRDFLEVVLDHFEKTKIAEYCEEERERVLRNEKTMLEVSQKVQMADNSEHMDCKPEPRLIAASDDPNPSVASSAPSNELGRPHEDVQTYWDTVTLTPVTTTTTYTQLTPVTTTGDEFKIEQQCSTQQMLAGSTPVTREDCTDAWSLSTSAELLPADSLPLLQTDILPITNGPASPPSPSKSLRCTICRKTFPSRGHLTRHSLVHTDARPYHCRYCPAAFKRAHHRTEHERTHTGERPYPCRYCTQRYTRASSRNDHELAHLKAANQQRQAAPPVSIAPASSVVQVQLQPQQAILNTSEMTVIAVTGNEKTVTKMETKPTINTGEHHIKPERKLS